MQQHPLSAAFPAMSGEDFQALCDSIEAIGVQNPVTLFEGMVIDGWHRYTAATGLGIECPLVELSSDTDPRDFVLAQNKARRHITQAQLAMATSAVYAWHPLGANQHSEKRVDIECPPSKSNAELAQIAGVHPNTIKQAKQVQAAAPEVAEAVKRGDIGLPKAAAIAKLPREEQAAAISKPLPKVQKVAEKVAHDEVSLPQQQSEQQTELVEELREQVAILAEENDRLNDRMAVVAMDASEEERTAASEMLKMLRQQVHVLSAELDAVKSVRNSLMVENGVLKSTVQSLQRQLKKVAA